MSENEIQLEYAKRQFEWYKTMASISVAQGNLQAAENYARYMQESSDFIDSMMRKIHDKVL